MVRGKTLKKKEAKEIVVVLGIFSDLKACLWSLLEVFFLIFLFTNIEKRFKMLKK